MEQPPSGKRPRPEGQRTEVVDGMGRGVGNQGCSHQGPGVLIKQQATLPLPREGVSKQPRARKRVVKARQGDEGLERGPATQEKGLERRC